MCTGAVRCVAPCSPPAALLGVAVLQWLGLPCAAPPSPLLGALRLIPLGVGVVLLTALFFFIFTGAVQALAQVQEAALRKHVGIFSYGDPGDSDDE